MKVSKLKKQLMACGVQRNDAAAFIRSYRQIQKAGMHRLCKDIMNPPMPVHFQKVNYHVETLRGTYQIPKEKLYSCIGDEFERMVKTELSRRIADALMDNAVVIRQRELLYEQALEFEATVKVVIPEGR